MDTPSLPLNVLAQILQQRRLARSLGSHDRAAPFERVKPREEILPAAFQKPVANREHARNGKRILARLHVASACSGPAPMGAPALGSAKGPRPSAWSLARSRSRGARLLPSGRLRAPRPGLLPGRRGKKALGFNFLSSWGWI